MTHKEKVFDKLGINNDFNMTFINWDGKNIESYIKKCKLSSELFLLARSLKIDNRNAMLAKSYSVNSVRHKIKNEIYLKAIDNSILYWEFNKNVYLPDIVYLETLTNFRDISEDPINFYSNFAIRCMIDTDVNTTYIQFFVLHIVEYSKLNFKKYRKITTDITKKYLGGPIIEKVNYLLQN